MAKLPFFALFLVFFLLLASPEIGMVEGKLCERRSQTWTGVCVKTGNCNKQCRSREGASSGSCHYQFPGFACFCYFKC